MLQVGDSIPQFALPTDTLGVVKASDLLGQRFVLYFYPKDNTTGCTLEACNFRDNLQDFNTMSVPVYGISPDTVASHARFRAQFGLTFPLLADEEHKVAEAFGVWVEKSMYGRKYMGIQRSTFIIGPDGVIEHIWARVTPADHAKEVLAHLKSLPESKTRDIAEAADAASVFDPALEPATPPARESGFESTPVMVAEETTSVVTVNPIEEVKQVETETTVVEIAPVSVPVPAPAVPAAKKPAARKSAAKKVAAKKSAAKKPAAKKPAAKKSAAKKPAAKKSAAKKPAAKKSAAKKTTSR